MRERNLLAWVALGGAVLLLAGCIGPVTVREADQGKIVSLGIGDPLIVELEGNPSTGYAWGAGRAPRGDGPSPGERGQVPTGQRHAWKPGDLYVPLSGLLDRHHAPGVRVQALLGDGGPGHLRGDSGRSVVRGAAAHDVG
ncbi:MAG: hypothetical protein NT125_05140 [Candidatus Bipolaricaulota bacterium]|nr:hypothetical protein [Candidatus Bipolaricaulota bacterium]